ncbi:hypothetical protein [Streptomyces sp. JH34]|uniref:arsenate reductase/protein-tyrosine-phosphatase family protein n=1 Tax=Streptomyces sp. JH34 TaxID=2793633 RepID=UPI0023F7058D|nr:hypothetical protein [Streptomyces sp. JH34]MDF6017038.1 hypothetical protein [Streptomyces sp. JH34]
MDTPAVASVLFVCVHNAGRSQMAAAFLTHLAHLGADRVQVRSVGSAPAGTVNPAVVEALAEVGIDISAETPKVLTTAAVQASNVGSISRATKRLRDAWNEFLHVIALSQVNRGFRNFPQR